MKKIVYIVESLEKGVGKHIQDLYLKISDKKEFEIYILYGMDRASEDILKKIDSQNLVPIKNLKRKIGINDIKAIFEINKHLKRIKPDIVHCHSSKAGLSGRISAKLSGVSYVIYSPHAYFFLKFDSKSFKRKLFICAERLLSKFFSNITITTSKGEDDDFIKYKLDKKDKKILIEHGIEISEVSKKEIDDERRKYNVTDKNVFVGAMARFEEQKDPIGTFEIMKKLTQNNSNVKCVFWGNGTFYDEVKKLNEENNNIIILPGETKTPEINLNALDIYLTASLYEGLPYTLLTSLAVGLPIAASNVEGNKDCVFDGKNGVLFDAKDYEGAVNKIEYIIKENQFEQMKKESLKIFKERFSMERMIEKYRSLYLDE